MKIRSGPSQLRRIGVVLALALLGGWAVAPAAHAYVYWANGGSGGTTIGRANLDGTGANQSFITGANTPEGVAVDGAHVYWANYNANSIGRANLDGSSPDQSFIAGANAPYGEPAVDGAHVYWVNGVASGSIGRANLDGNPASVDQSFITGANLPCGVAVDSAHVYWADDSGGGSIGRANLDGLSPNQSFITGASNPCGVAVDGTYIYWANQNANTIGRANLDGNPASVDQSFITGANLPCGVAVDGQHVYWANKGDGTIGRANLDGAPASVDQSFITGAGAPCGVAVDALPLPPGGTGSPGGTGTPSALASITDLRISPSVFPAGNSGGSIARRTGARVSYRDSQPAVTSFAVLKATPGVRRGTRCVRPRSGITGRRCIRYVRVGSFRHADRAGLNRFHFTGRVRHRKLRPGRYRLRAVPRFAGQNGQPTAKGFRVIG